MVFDRTEDEPDEWDPEEEFYDPDSDGLTIPQVSTEYEHASDDAEDLHSIDVPTVSTDETDVPGEILRAFWTLVLVLNAAILFVSLGLMVLVFEGDLRDGGILLVGGIALLALAGRRYRQFPTVDDTSASGDTDTDDGSGADAEPDGSAVEDAAETTSGEVHQEQSPTRNERS